MPITDAQRNRLFNTLREKIGEPEAEIMMELLPPVGWGDVATKRDLGILGADIRLEMAQLGSDLRVEMADLRSELRGEMAQLATGLRVEMADLRSELRVETAQLATDLRGEMAQLSPDLRTEMVTQTNRFVGWMLASQASFFAILAVLVYFR